MFFKSGPQGIKISIMRLWFWYNEYTLEMWQRYLNDIYNIMVKVKEIWKKNKQKRHQKLRLHNDYGPT